MKNWMRRIGLRMRDGQPHGDLGLQNGLFGGLGAGGGCQAGKDGNRLSRKG
jgi:hypothetical protein